MSRLLCLAAALTLGTALEHPPFYVGQTCSDGSGCPDAEVCCPYYSSANANIDDDQPSKGFLCCNPPADGRNASATCCGGGCCDPVETCAADSQGYACCVEQVTYACEAQQEIGLPARCCPRQTVCSSVGTVGCSDPAMPWQITDPAATVSRNGRAPRPFRAAPSAVGSSPAEIRADPATLDRAAANGELAYALLVVGEHLKSFAINTSDGTVLSKVGVAGYNNWQESTRMFAFDSKRARFHLFEANFTEARPAGGRPITLYTVDARTGATTARPLAGGAVDYPTGFSYDAASDTLLLATEARTGDGAAADTVSGHHFHTVDADAAVATRVSTSSRDPAKEDDAAFYAGYVTAPAPGGKSVLRLGFSSVATGTGKGLGETDLTSASASSSWRTDVPRAAGCGFPMSLQPESSGSYLSLASQAQGKQSFSVVRWTAGGGATAVAALANAHTPREPHLGPLGYVGDALSSDGNTYYAMAAQQASLPVLDSWAISVVDLTGAAPTRSLPLKPAVLAGTASLSGFGVPAL